MLTIDDVRQSHVGRHPNCPARCCVGRALLEVDTLTARLESVEADAAAMRIVLEQIGGSSGARPTGSFAAELARNALDNSSAGAHLLASYRGYSTLPVVSSRSSKFTVNSSSVENGVPMYASRALSMISLIALSPAPYSKRSVPDGPARASRRGSPAADVWGSHMALSFAYPPRFARRTPTWKRTFALMASNEYPRPLRLAIFASPFRPSV